MAVSLGVISEWSARPPALAVFREGLFDACFLAGVGLQIQPPGPFSVGGCASLGKALAVTFLSHKLSDANHCAETV